MSTNRERIAQGKKPTKPITSAKATEPNSAIRAD